MSASRKTIFLIVGQTASGKDSLVNAMCQGRQKIMTLSTDKDNNEQQIITYKPYKQLVSYTTRPKRENEGDTHIFISRSEVEQYKDDMIAYTQIGEYEYFATKEQLRNCNFYIIDYDGVKYLRSQQLNDEFRFVTIYINTPDEIRKERALSARKDNKEIFDKRNKTEESQFNDMRTKADFDYSINNINFDKAFKILKYIVEVESKYETI